MKPYEWEFNVLLYKLRPQNVAASMLARELLTITSMKICHLTFYIEKQ